MALTSSSKARKPAKGRKPKKKKARLHTKAEALSMAQRLARLRDTNGGTSTTKCISCGKPLDYESSQGGHYISRTVLCICDDLDNINAQCPACNMFGGGNPIGYRRGLVAKIGIERVERLEDMYLASRGNEEALERLDASDREKVTAKRSKRYWDERYKELKDECERIGRD